jgi:holliday junction DNA helicase RuvA
VDEAKIPLEHHLPRLRTNAEPRMPNAGLSSRYSPRVLTRLSGTLESIIGTSAVVAPPGGWLALEVLLPAYVAQRLTPQVGKGVTLHTLMYLEGQGQGASFVPRLIGFPTPIDRAFFDLFTSVNGIGNRKALRALAMHPGAIARAIHEQDVKLLSTLPEIGKRMAERIVTELSGKETPWLMPCDDDAKPITSRIEVKSTIASGLTGPAEDAVRALMALGQTRSEAEENVARALAKAKQAKRTLESPERIVEAVFGA